MSASRDAILASDNLLPIDVRWLLNIAVGIARFPTMDPGRTLPDP